MHISQSVMSLFLISLCLLVESERLTKYSYELSDYPRIIWSYYVGEMPPYIKEMFDITVATLNSTWKYYFLTNDNITDYLDTSSLPSHFSLLLPQHQSDLIRLGLLEKYGGWWMDNGIIVNSEIEIERIYNKIVENKAEFYGTCIYECPLKDVETCFIYAKRGSGIIRKWMEEMKEVYKIGEANYIHKVYREGVNVPKISFVRYPKVNPYMVIFAAFEKAKFRDTPRNSSIVIEPADDVLYAMHRYVREKGTTFKDVYYNKELRRLFPIIKLGGWIRVKLFHEKKITGFESYEPFALKTGSKTGTYAKLKIIMYLLIFFSTFTLLFEASKELLKPKLKELILKDKGHFSIGKGHLSI